MEKGRHVITNRIFDGPTEPVYLQVHLDEERFSKSKLKKLNVITENMQCNAVLGTFIKVVFQLQYRPGQ